MSSQKSDALISAWICFSFYARYLLRRGEKKRPDNAIADVLSQPAYNIGFLGGGGGQVSISFSINIKRACLPLVSDTSADV